MLVTAPVSFRPLDIFFFEGRPPEDTHAGTHAAGHQYLWTSCIILYVKLVNYELCLCTSYVFVKLPY